VHREIIIADGSDLVCLDSSDGQVRWVTSAHKSGVQSAFGNFEMDKEGIYVWGHTHFLSESEKTIAATNPHLVEGRDEYWLERYSP